MEGYWTTSAATEWARSPGLPPLTAQRLHTARIDLPSGWGIIRIDSTIAEGARGARDEAIDQRAIFQ